MRKKLDAHSQEAIFLGYSMESKAYRPINLTNKRIIISRDVIFDEGPSDIQEKILIHEDDEKDLLDLDLLRRPSTTMDST